MVRTLDDFQHINTQQSKQKKKKKKNTHRIKTRIRYSLRIGREILSDNRHLIAPLLLNLEGSGKAYHPSTEDSDIPYL